MTNQVIIFEAKETVFFPEILKSVHPECDLNNFYSFNCGKGFPHSLKSGEFHKLKSKLGFKSFFEVAKHLILSNVSNKRNVCLTVLGFDHNSVKKFLLFLKENDVSKLGCRIFVFIDTKTLFSIASIKNVLSIQISEIVIRKLENNHFNISPERQ